MLPHFNIAKIDTIRFIDLSSKVGTISPFLIPKSSKYLANLSDSLFNSLYVNFLSLYIKAILSGYFFAFSMNNSIIDF